jgi:hypothetical protein
MKIFTAGDPLKASELNGLVADINQANHNILELLMENYFASKLTPYQGLFFDGFSDTTKKSAGAGVTSGSTASGQANIVLASSAQASSFVIGEKIQIYNGTTQEVKTITNIVSATLTVDSNLANTYANGCTVTACSATIDTANKKLLMTAGVGDLKKVIYQSAGLTYNQKMAMLKLWVMRKVTAHNPLATIANGATTLTVADVTVPYANGDYIELVNTANKIRERKLISNVSTAGAGAVAYVAGYANSGGGSGWTRSYTIASGSDRLLVCFTQSTGGNLTSLQFNGVAMTKLGGITAYGENWETWYMVNPPVGTFNMVAVSPSGGNSFNYAIMNFTGVNQSDPVGAFASANHSNSATSVNFNVTGYSTNDLIVDCYGKGSYAPYTGQTSRLSFNQTIMTSTKAGAIGAVNMRWDGSPANAYGSMGMALKASTPVHTVTFAPAVIVASGFATADRIERVDVKPQVSVVGIAGNVSLVDMTFNLSQDATVDTEAYVEDEYTYVPATPEQKIKVLLEITRVDATLVPEIKRLGASLTT